MGFSMLALSHLLAFIALSRVSIPKIFPKIFRVRACADFVHEKAASLTASSTPLNFSILQEICADFNLSQPLRVYAAAGEALADAAAAGRVGLVPVRRSRAVGGWAPSPEGSTVDWTLTLGLRGPALLTDVRAGALRQAAAEALNRLARPEDLAVHSARRADQGGVEVLVKVRGVCRSCCGHVARRYARGALHQLISISCLPTKSSAAAPCA
jgi:hypothetical protein